MHEFRLSVGAGFWLAATLLPQTWGLKYTTATNSAFITILYVLIVPLLATLFQKIQIPKTHWLLTLSALFGVALMVQIQSLSMNLGDLLTLFCALMAAFHILYVDRVAPKSLNMFILNGFQALWCALFSLPLFFFGGSWSLASLSNLTWVGLLLLTLGSSLLAFYLQFRAQKYVNASTASLLFLLESPFSAVLAYFLLNERLTPLQMLGGLIIFMSCAFSLRLGPGKT
jgi:drug/metabolite transporter (DMT)-like permease